MLPKRFPILISVIFLLYGTTVGFYLDHTLSLRPLDFYDVNDNSTYELFDFLTYIMYGPFSYYISYFFDKFKLKKQHLLFYIVLWSFIALGFEWVGVQLEVYQYEKGWKIEYSYPSYLVIVSVLMYLYYKLCRQNTSFLD